MKRSVLKKSLLTLTFATLLSIAFQYMYPDSPAWAVPVDGTALQDLAGKSFDGTVDNVRKYTDLAAAVTAIGRNVRTLLIPVGTDVKSNVTVPDNITLLFWGDGKLNITGGTVSVNGPMEASMKQIFNCTGTGKVSFYGSKGIMDRVYPQWWGAKGDSIADDTPAIQAAVDAAATINSNDGGTVFFPIGYYKTVKPIILPRTGNIPTRTVRLQGSGMRGGTILGNMAVTSFPRNRALIEWEQTTAGSTWHQSIKDMTFSLPNIEGVSAIHYKVTDNSSREAILNETLQLDLENLTIYGCNIYHDSLIKLEGNVKYSSIKNIYGDCNMGPVTWWTKLPDDKKDGTLVLEVDYAYGSGDGSGLHYSRLQQITGGMTRGGLHQVFKGRIYCCDISSSLSGIGNMEVPNYYFINSQSSTITGIGTEGRSEKPQIKFENCSQLVLTNVTPGCPDDTGCGWGNGIELVNTDDCIWTAHWRGRWKPAFYLGPNHDYKNLVLDAACERNRFYNWLIVGSIANEIQDNGTDNYGEFYDVSGRKLGHQFMGKLCRGDVNVRDLSGLSGISGTGIAARNLRGTVTVSGTSVCADVTFGTGKEEIDAAYYLTLTPVTQTGIPADNSRRILSVDKSAAGFRINVMAAPGTGNSITYDWHLVR
ncbi:MAG: glycosyl hydrolase family 28-related protein [bacterium]|nr:glycosyl hydrolase family 28-related protein [bacterium]